MVHFDQGTWQGADLPDLDPQLVLPTLESGLPTPRQGAKLQPHLLYG